MLASAISDAALARGETTILIITLKSGYFCRRGLCHPLSAKASRNPPPFVTTAKQKKKKTNKQTTTNKNKNKNERHTRRRGQGRLGRGLGLPGARGYGRGWGTGAR